MSDSSLFDYGTELALCECLFPFWLRYWVSTLWVTLPFSLLSSCSLDGLLRSGWAKAPLTESVERLFVALSIVMICLLAFGCSVCIRVRPFFFRAIRLKQSLLLFFSCKYLLFLTCRPNPNTSNWLRVLLFQLLFGPLYLGFAYAFLFLYNGACILLSWASALLSVFLLVFGRSDEALLIYWASALSFYDNGAYFLSWASAFVVIRFHPFHQRPRWTSSRPPLL